METTAKLTADGLAEIRKRAEQDRSFFPSHADSHKRAEDMLALLAALEAAQDALAEQAASAVKAQGEADEALARRNDALASLSAMTLKRDALAAERDTGVLERAKLAARVAELERSLESSRRDYERILESRDKAEQDSDDYAARVAELEGIRPELPPRPPRGSGLPRYGLRWNGPKTPLSVPMADGYWTPYHLAVGKVAELEANFATARAQAFLDAAEEVSTYAGELVGNGQVAAKIDGLEAARDIERNIRILAATSPEQAPGMDTCARDVWRCSGCGEMLDHPPGTAWRWNGKAWEHRCPERDPQSGYEPAKNFGPRVAPEQAPRTDDGARPCRECFHSAKCKWLLGPSYMDCGPCDWDPSRFQPARPADVGADWRTRGRALFAAVTALDRYIAAPPETWPTRARMLRSAYEAQEDWLEIDPSAQAADAGAAPPASTGTAPAPADSEQIRRDQEGRRLGDMAAEEARKLAEAGRKTCSTCRDFGAECGIPNGVGCEEWGERDASGGSGFVAPGAGESEGTA